MVHVVPSAVVVRLLFPMYIGNWYGRLVGSGRLVPSASARFPFPMFTPHRFFPLGPASPSPVPGALIKLYLYLYLYLRRGPVG